MQRIANFNTGWAIFMAGKGANTCANSDQVAGWDAAELYGPGASNAHRDSCARSHVESTSFIPRKTIEMDANGELWA